MRNIYEMIVDYLTVENPNYENEILGIGGVWL